MATNRPNVILITTDQQRFDSVRANGGHWMHTPNMDRIAVEGVSFTRAYCPNTVCTPSRVSMMTGLYLSRHGSYNIGTRVVDEAPFLSTLLRAAGYRTHHIGKAHWNPFLEGARPSPVGKALRDPEWAESPEVPDVDAAGSPVKDFVGFETAEPCVGHTTYGVTGHYEHWLKQQGFDPESLELQPLFEGDPNETGDWNLPTRLHSGHWLAERAIDFLRNHDGTRPFFLNLGFQDPHHPHVLPSDFAHRVDPDAIPLPDRDIDGETGVADHIPLFRAGTLMESRFVGRFVIAGNGPSPWHAYFMDEAKARATRAYYYSLVQLIDEQLGRILEALDDLGLSENTLLIFASDHGEMLGDHAIGQKGPLAYEGVARIPMMMRFPGGFAPTRVDECVSLVDIVPTVLDFLGVADPIRRDGISLKERLRNGTPLDREGVRIEFKEEPDRIRFKCWVTPEWKLAVYLGEEFGELYDLKRDPGEKHNLFDDPQYQGVKAQLLIQMLGDMERSEPVNPRPSRA